MDHKDHKDQKDKDQKGYKDKDQWIIGIANYIRIRIFGLILSCQIEKIEYLISLKFSIFHILTKHYVYELLT